MGKRILFVGDSNSIHLKKYTDYFLCNGYDVYLATFSNSNITNVRNIFFLSKLRINKNGKNYHYLFSIYSLTKILKLVKPNYINAHFSYSMGFITYLALKLSGIKVSFSVVCHGSDILDYPLLIFRYINKVVLNKADKIISVSNQITDKIIELGIDSKKIFTGQYGVDLQNDLIERARDVDIISIRNYVPNSRIDELLDVLGQECFVHKKIVIVLPGISDNKFRYFQKKYPNINLYKYIEHNKLMNLLYRSKFYISATKSDGSSLSLLEAMTCGVIPIVSNIPSNREWILDGLNGILFRDFNELYNILLSKNIDIQSFRNINCKIIDMRGCYSKQMKMIEDFLLSKLC